MSWSVLILSALLAQAGEPVPLVPVDQGVADVSPLQTSLRVAPIDLRHPSDFERVYETGDGRYMRVSGGLRAVFPISVYDPYGPEIPPDTRFIIGETPTLDALERRRERGDEIDDNPYRVDRSVSVDLTTPPPSERERASIWNDEAYRISVVGRLLGAALANRDPAGRAQPER